MTEPSSSGAPGALLDIPPSFASVDAAQTRLAELQSQQEWPAKVLAGDPAALREFQAITERIAAGDDESLPGVAAPGQKVLVDGQISRADAAVAIADLRGLGLAPEVVAEVFSGSKNSPEVVAETRARYQRRMHDPTWTAALLDGDMEARRELALLCAILSGQVTEG